MQYSSIRDENVQFEAYFRLEYERFMVTTNEHHEWNNRTICSRQTPNFLKYLTDIYVILISFDFNLI